MDATLKKCLPSLTLRLGVGQQLGWAFGFALVVMGVFVAGALVQQRAMERSLREFGDVELDRIRHVDRWIAMSEDTSLRIMAVNKSNDAGIAEFFGPTIAPRVKEVGEMFRKVEAEADSDEERAWMAAFVPKREALLKALGEMAEYKKIGDVAGASAMFDSAFMPAQKAYNEEIRRYGELQRERLARKLEAVEAAGQRSARLAAGAAIVLTLAGALFAWRVAGHIKRSLDAAVQAARRVAGGDLSQRIEVRGHDEFAALMRSMDDMTQGLERIVREVRHGTEGITVASGEIAQGNSDLSTRTEQQAGSLQQTASAMEQLTTTVQHNASTARQADDLARQATDVATQGGTVVSQVVHTMGEISHASRRIEEIIGVIDGISFQTNILALNAAVEAARAGEQGRGFAVVAGEVRNLAQRSATAAKEIKALIADSVDKVRNGTSQVEVAGRTMDETVAAIRRVSQLMAEISAATSQQTAGISHVNSSVAQLDQMTQQNAALVEESAAAAQSLKDQSVRLSEVVATFRLSTTDSAHVAPRLSPPGG